MERHDGDDWLESGRLLFARPVTFMLSVVAMDKLPPPDLPEVCFAKRPIRRGARGS